MSEKLTTLLKKLEKADHIISTNLENMDLAKSILVPKWKVWLLLRIFGEGVDSFEDDEATSLLTQIDESFRWDELPTAERLAGYGHSEDIICSLVNDRLLKEEIGDLDNIIDDIRKYIPEKKTILKTSFDHDKCIVESEIICKSEDKVTLTINIGVYGKTVVQYGDKKAYISHGKRESVYGPYPHRVPISELTYNILKDIGAADDSYINSNKILELVGKMEKQIKSYKIKLVKEEGVDFDEAGHICNSLRYWMFVRIFKTTIPTGAIMAELRECMSPMIKKLYNADNDRLDLITRSFDFESMEKLIDEIYKRLSPEAVLYVGDMAFDKIYNETGVYTPNKKGSYDRHKTHELEIGLKNIFASDIMSSSIILKTFRTDWSGLWVGIVGVDDDEIHWLSRAGVQDLRELVEQILNWTKEAEQQ